MPVVPNASVERYSTGYSHLTDPIALHTPITAIQRSRRCLLAARQRSRCGKTSRRDGPVHVLRRVLWTSGHCRGSRVWSAFDLRCASCSSRGGFGVVSVWPKGRHHEVCERASASSYNETWHLFTAAGHPPAHVITGYSSSSSVTQFQ